MQRVFVDATVVFSRTQRDWLLHARVVTGGEMFTLHTSEDVLNEALARLRDKHPAWDGGQISRVRATIKSVFDEVLDDFPGTIVFPGADQGDRHVHAAAVHAQSDILLTADRGLLELRDDSGLPYEPMSPDEFFVLIDDSAPSSVREMAQRQINYFASREQRPELAERLREARCPDFADRVILRVAELAGPRAVRRLQAQQREL